MDLRGARPYTAVPECKSRLYSRSNSSCRLKLLFTYHNEACGLVADSAVVVPGPHVGFLKWRAVVVVGVVRGGLGVDNNGESHGAVDRESRVKQPARDNWAEGRRARYLAPNFVGGTK